MKNLVLGTLEPGNIGGGLRKVHFELAVIIVSDGKDKQFCDFVD